MKKNLRFDSLVIHAGQDPENWHGATRAPVVQSAAHAFDTAEAISQAFAGAAGQDVYLRLTNPTNRALEDKLAALEGGAGAVVSASGMAAVSTACLTLLRAGDEIVAGRTLFLSTGALFTQIFKKYGIGVRLVPTDDANALAAAVSDKTRLVYLEVIGNPRLDVPDIKAWAEAAHALGLPLVVDATLASPYLLRPVELGADVVVHSTTKYLNGHGSALGGVVVDAGRFDWAASPRFADMAPFVARKGRLAYLDRLWRETHINLGPAAAPWHSYLTMLGLDTLALRMRRHLDNALTVAEFLAERPEVAFVNYPGLPGSPCHEVAARQFEGRGFGALLTFGLKDAAACRRLIDALTLISNLANLGDAKTLILHPRSTQFVSFDDAAAAAWGVTPEMLRLSVGIEHVDDICEDLARGLEAAGR